MALKASDVYSAADGWSEDEREKAQRVFDQMGPIEDQLRALLEGCKGEREISRNLQNQIDDFRKQLDRLSAQLP